MADPLEQKKNNPVAIVWSDVASENGGRHAPMESA